MESSKGMGMQRKGGGKGRDGHRGINKERNGERSGKGRRGGEKGNKDGSRGGKRVTERGGWNEGKERDNRSILFWDVMSTSLVYSYKWFVPRVKSLLFSRS
jgi:hypothetical protein